MDEKAKTQFRWKFYRLTVELNIVILLAAMSIPVYLIIRSPLTLPLIALMLIIALVVLTDFLKRYRETKAWLDDVAEQEEKQKQHPET